LSRYEDYNDHPRMIALCLHCPKPDCEEPCRERAELIRELRGRRCACSERVVRRGREYVVMAEGQVFTIRQWAARAGVCYNTMYGRLVTQGMDPVSALGNRDVVTVTVDGWTGSVAQWEKRLGLGKNVLYAQIRREGITAEEAVRKRLGADARGPDGRTDSGQEPDMRRT